MFDSRFRAGVNRSTEPVGRWLVRTHVNADMLTGLGLVFAVVSAVEIGLGHLVWGVVGLVAVGMADLFDGAVAKAAKEVSVRGTFFDSVADRFSDALVLGGVAWYLVESQHGIVVMVPVAILGLTAIISYERAKAEGLGLVGRGGVMERGERLVCLGACLVAGAVDVTAMIVGLWVLFGLVLFTAVGRFVRVWQETEAPLRTNPLEVSLKMHKLLSREGKQIGEERASMRRHRVRVSERWIAKRHERRLADTRRRRLSHPKRIEVHTKSTEIKG